MTRTAQRLLVVGGLLMPMLGCLWGLIDAGNGMPQPLLEANGVVASTVLSQGRGAVNLQFRLHGDERRFGYSGALPAADEVQARLQVGSRVELQHGPRGPFDVWWLRVDGQTLLHHDQRERSVRRGGAVILLLMVVPAVLAAWLWRVMAPPS
ncbi:MAG: hypothetical protein C0434_15795 [Xanthomonadaceae bacterium]|nr:hypothetical protein [Xanthomonadaceae bacterium]